MTLREGGMDDIHHALKKKTVTKVKAENELMLSRFEQMTGQDKVLLVHGTWVRDSDQRWIFEPDITAKVEHFIRIFSGMTMTELLTSVRERYKLSSTDATLKLSYQYPEWVSFGDAELEMPQYITEDTEVGVFLNMRRSIEEVPLYVSIYRQSHGGKLLTKERETEQRVPMAEDGVDGIDEEDWHTFALSETPLTMPLTQPQTKAIPHEVPDYSVTKAARSKERLPTIPHSPGGIVITERGDPTRATRRQTGPTDREKNKRHVEEDTESESESDDDMVVPVVPPVVGETGEGSRPVRRRLLFGNAGIPDTDGGVGDSNSGSDHSEELPVADGLHWGKFDEALHEMLNNPNTPAFFGRDAPPVYNHAQHVICVVHLWRNVMAKYKSSRLANLMSAAARAFTVTEFNKKFIEIQKISPNCTAYLKGGSSSNRKCKRCGRSGHNRASCRNPI
ncbi:hypothetical protein IGI04_030774 [Brassica rapa subsp. trilocularis]|uniref:CCHC-type domain-containing protein n=1 Tax=Brassica rapa subsp. trilocularis TaxID=1813537 RepID=A0ABQ7LUD4_BRACM|nr:hypothetical protein IGI04_030774 [Brassica rapa subsp. trilocularis]